MVYPEGRIKALHQIEKMNVKYRNKRSEVGSGYGSFI